MSATEQRASVARLPEQAGRALRVGVDARTVPVRGPEACASVHAAAGARPAVELRGASLVLQGTGGLLVRHHAVRLDVHVGQLRAADDGSPVASRQEQLGRHRGVERDPALRRLGVYVQAGETHARLAHTPVTGDAVQLGRAPPVAKHVLSLRRPVPKVVAGRGVALRAGGAQHARLPRAGVAPGQRHERHRQQHPRPARRSHVIRLL